MKLTPDTIDSALVEEWGARWQEAVDIPPGADLESFAFKLTCIDAIECESCETIWQDSDIEFNRRLDAYICPTCRAWPGSWSGG